VEQIADSPERTVRSLGPRHARTDSVYDDWVAATMERIDPFMSWLGVLFALVVGFEIAAEPAEPWPTVIEFVSWTIWALFTLEFLVQLWLAPHRLRFVRRHWWQPLMILIPTLRLFRFVRLLRVGRALPAGRVVSSSYRAAGTAKTLLRSRTGYLAALATVAVIAIAELAYLFERDLGDGVFANFGEALLWSLATVIGMQGDPVPSSTGGKLAMLAGFASGLVIIAALAGSIGAYLVDGRRERDAEEA
jgi:voltage-gated potassium channel